MSLEVRESLPDFRDGAGRGLDLVGENAEDLGLVRGMLRDDHDGRRSGALHVELDAAEALDGYVQGDARTGPHEDATVGDGDLAVDGQRPGLQLFIGLQEPQDHIVFGDFAVLHGVLPRMRCAQTAMLRPRWCDDRQAVAKTELARCSQSRLQALACRERRRRVSTTAGPSVLRLITIGPVAAPATFDGMLRERVLPDVMSCDGVVEARAGRRFGPADADERVVATSWVSHEAMDAALASNSLAGVEYEIGGLAPASVPGGGI